MTILLKVSFVVAHCQKNITARERGHSLIDKKKVLHYSRIASIKYLNWDRAIKHFKLENINFQIEQKT